MNALLSSRRDGRSKIAQWMRSSRWACPAASALAALLLLLVCLSWSDTKSTEPGNKLWAWTTHTDTKTPPIATIAGLQSMVKANTSIQYSAQQYESLARLRQEVFCTDAHPVRIPDAKVVKITDTVSMHLLAKKDFVSQVLIEGRVWEEEDLNAALWALEQPLPKGYSQNSNDSLFVDIGANVGAFTFRIASAGYKVFAFEGMRDNQLLLRSSLCESDPVIMSRVTLFPYGAGASHQTCVLIADQRNLGDGITVCDEKELADPLSRGYIVRSRMEILPIDWMVQRDVKVMKIDVEGFEPFVFQGARQLLTQHRVWYIMAEFNIMVLRGSLKGTTQKTTDYVSELKRLGYAVSIKSFQGPWMTDEEIKALDDITSPRAFNLYLVHPLLMNQATVSNRTALY